MKKYKLRHFFSIEHGGEVIVGPKEIELDDKTAEINKHKLEPIEKQEQPEPKKKGKAE